MHNVIEGGFFHYNIYMKKNMNYFERAKTYFNKGQFDYALIDCEYAQKICESSAASEISEFRKKIIERKTATYTHRNAEKYQCIASAAMRKGNYDSAIKAATKAIKLYHCVPLFHLYGEVSRSAWFEYIDKVLDSYLLRAQAYFETGDYDLVLEDCEGHQNQEKYLRYDNQILRAKAYLKKDDYEMAIFICERMKWKRPDFYTISAEAHLKNKNYLFAIEHCRKAFEAVEKEDYCMDKETGKALNYFIRAQSYFLSENKGIAFEDCEYALNELAEREWETTLVGVGDSYYNDLCGGSLAAIKKIRKLRDEISKYYTSITPAVI